MSIIADLIRAGVDPELVARVAEEIAAAARNASREGEAAKRLRLREMREKRLAEKQRRWG